MNENSDRKQSAGRKKVAALLLLLAILLLLSMVVLASRMGDYTRSERKNEIPIGEETVSSEDGSRKTENTENTEQEEPRSEDMVIEHDVEIFRVSYANGEAQVTVLSGDGDKLIAPGTSWDYAFTLRNARNKAIDYIVRVESRVEGMDGIDGSLPVTARMGGPGGWLTAEDGSFIPVLGLNDVTHSGVLSAGNIEDFRLEWQWPFESGHEEADAFDTMLGNMALDHDIVLYINIIVEAQEDVDPNAIGGVSPATGDDFSAALWVTVMVLSLFAFVFVLIRNEDSKKRFAPQKTARDK